MPITAPQTTGPGDNPATVGDLASRGYTGTGPEGQTRLDEAWRALRGEVPSLLTRMASGEVDEGMVVDVIAAAALRVLRNPEGYVEGAGAIDDYREDWKRRDATQDMYFTAAELRRVSPPTFQNAGSFKYS